jgi:hypothetical protein
VPPIALPISASALFARGAFAAPVPPIALPVSASALFGPGAFAARVPNFALPISAPLRSFARPVPLLFAFRA